MNLGTYAVVASSQVTSLIVTWDAPLPCSLPCTVAIACFGGMAKWQRRDWELTSGLQCNDTRRDYVGRCSATSLAQQAACVPLIRRSGCTQHRQRLAGACMLRPAGPAFNIAFPLLAPAQPQPRTLPRQSARGPAPCCAVAEQDAELSRDVQSRLRSGCKVEARPGAQQHEPEPAAQQSRHGRLPRSVPATAPPRGGGSLTAGGASLAVTTQYRRLKRRLKLQPSQQYDDRILAISGPAVIALAADPLLSLIDTAFVGRLGPAELVNPRATRTESTTDHVCASDGFSWLRLRQVYCNPRMKTETRPVPPGHMCLGVLCAGPALPSASFHRSNTPTRSRVLSPRGFHVTSR